MRKYVLGELAFLVLVLLLYVHMWMNVEPRAVTDLNEKQLGLSAINNAVQAGLIAVSILLPVSAGLLVLVIDKANQGLFTLLRHVQWACTYFFVSLLCGLWNLFRLPTIALQSNINLAYDGPTAIIEILQLLLVLIGVSRLVVGTWAIRRDKNKTN